jgi:hypothetical protein
MQHRRWSPNWSQRRPHPGHVRASSSEESSETLSYYFRAKEYSSEEMVV